MLKLRPICAYIALILSAHVQAQSSNGTNEYLDMTLDELLNVTVITSSKREELISRAPEVISVVSQNEIIGYGANTFKEILDRLTSVYSMGSYSSVNGIMTLRGSNTGNYGTNILLLINGRPLRSSMEGGFLENIYDLFPINQIDHLEVVRGPGSVLYGTNAYIGVINIITKSPDTENTNVSIKYGSFGTRQMNLSMNKKMEVLGIAAGINVIKSDGWNFIARGENEVIKNPSDPSNPTLLPSKSMKRNLDGIATNLKLTYDAFTLSQVTTYTDLNLMSINARWPKAPFNTPLKTKGILSFTDLEYKHSLTENWDYTLNATNNYHQYDVYYPTLPGEGLMQEYSANDTLFELSSNVKIGNDINLVGGVLTSIQTGHGYSFNFKNTGESFDITASENPQPWNTVPNYNDKTYSAYFQGDYAPFPYLKLIAGTQANKASELDWHYVPRFTAILSQDNKYGLKLIYGKAFRSGTAFERVYQQPGIFRGTPNIQPEQIATSSAQIFYTTSKAMATLTYFYSHDDRKIIRVPSNDSIITSSGLVIKFPVTYVNSGYINSNGLEFEGKLSPFNILSLMGSLSYQATKDDKNRQDYAGTPTKMAKIGILFNEHGLISTGIFNSYFGKGGNYFLQPATNTAYTVIANPEIEAYNDLSANIRFDLKQYFPNSASGKFEFYVTNLLNESIYYPENLRRNINSLPGRPGRAIYGSLTVAF